MLWEPIPIPAFKPFLLSSQLLFAWDNWVTLNCQVLTSRQMRANMRVFRSSHWVWRQRGAGNYVQRPRSQPKNHNQKPKITYLMIFIRNLLQTSCSQIRTTLSVLAACLPTTHYETLAITTFISLLWLNSDVSLVIKSLSLFLPRTSYLAHKTQAPKSDWHLLIGKT